MKNNEYKCSMCKNIYENLWTDEEAEKECIENYGEEMAHGEDREIVCDDCYKLLFHIQ